MGTPLQLGSLSTHRIPHPKLWAQEIAVTCCRFDRPFPAYHCGMYSAGRAMLPHAW